MEYTTAKHLQAKTLEATSGDELRPIMIERFAKCLIGELERGAKVAHYRAPRIVVGVNLVVNYDLSDLSKQVEYALNTTAARHRQEKLRADYKVTLNAVNGTLRFTACMRNA